MSDFQHRAGEHGALFDDQCRSILHHVGFKDVSDRPIVIVELGCSVDAVAYSQDGTEYRFEFKGSWIGARPGLRRTDTVKKAITTGLLAKVDHREHPEFIILTSHMPAIGSSGDRMLNVALAGDAVADVICINDPSDIEQLRLIAEGES